MFSRIGQVLCWTVAVMALQSSAMADDDPVALRRTEACMLKVLKETAGVKGVTFHVPPAHMNDMQFYPFVEYSYKGEGVSFSAIKMYEGNRITYSFQAGLPGISAEGTAGPSDRGTVLIEGKWKKQCGAIAVTLFV